MRLFRLLTLRSMRSRSLRFMLSGFGIILGVAGMLSIQATNQTALNSILNLFESTSGRAKLVVASADTDEGGFSENILTKIDAVEGVLVSDPLIIEVTDLADKQASDQLDISFFGASGGGLLVHGIVPALEIQTRDYILREGRFLTNGLKEREIVLVESFAEDEGIQVSDLIKIITPNGTKELKVVGLIAREGPGKTNNGSFGVIPLETARQLFNRSNELDQIDIVPVNPNPGTSELAELRATLQQEIGDNYSVTYPSGQGERMTQMLQNYQIGLNFMSGIALFVGAFLIYNAFAMTVVERTREFGMLRTIGMTRRQVISQVLVEAGFLRILRFCARGWTGHPAGARSDFPDGDAHESGVGGGSGEHKRYAFQHVYWCGCHVSGSSHPGYAGRSYFTHRSVTCSRQIKGRLVDPLWLDARVSLAGRLRGIAHHQSVPL